MCHMVVISRTCGACRVVRRAPSGHDVESTFELTLYKGLSLFGGSFRHQAKVSSFTKNVWLEYSHKHLKPENSYWLRTQFPCSAWLPGGSTPRRVGPRHLFLFIVEYAYRPLPRSYLTFSSAIPREQRASAPLTFGRWYNVFDLKPKLTRDYLTRTQVFAVYFEWYTCGPMKRARHGPISPKRWYPGADQYVVVDQRNSLT